MQSNTCAAVPRQGLLLAPPVTPATVLTLPRLAPGIPHSFPLDGDRAEPCVLAKALALEGVLKPHQWSGEVVGACFRSMKEWTDWFKAFKMDLQVTFDLAHAGLEDDYRPTDNDVRGGFILTHDQPPIDNVFTLKRRVMELEGKCPGAGKAVMSALKHTDITIYQPADAFPDCRWFHWRGEPNEDDFARLARNEDGEDPGESAVKVRDWVQEMPDWVYKPKPISPAGLKALAHKARMPKVFDPLIAMYEFWPGVNETRHVRNTMGTVSPCILEWQPYGLVSRIFDDVLNEQVNAGDGTQIDVMAVLQFVDNVESVRAAAKKLNRLLQHIAVIREVIEQVTDPRKDE